MARRKLLDEAAKSDSAPHGVAKKSFLPLKGSQVEWCSQFVKDHNLFFQSFRFHLFTLLPQLCFYEDFHGQIRYLV